MQQSFPPDFSEVRGLHLLAAISGGADSVALLCMLADARQTMNLTLSAAHIDHSIRGAESLADVEFCRALCKQLDIPFYLETIDVPHIIQKTGEGLETAARRLRYAALRHIRTEAGADFIAVAHHLDDQAETVLMHLLRGCGPDGMAGMARFSGDLYRPLLGIPKEALTAYLERRGQRWRTDATNFEPDTPRNALRLHVLPIIEESYPQAAQAIARYAEASAVENRYMDRQADVFLQAHLEHGSYGQRLMHPENANEAILRRVIRRLCGSGLTSSKLRELTALCFQNRGKTEISASLTAERTPSALYFLPHPMELPAPAALNLNGITKFGALGEMEIHPCCAVPDGSHPLRQVLRREALENAVLRTRLDGDRIRPLGGGRKLLSDYLTDRKVDRPLRRTLPLIADGGRILWAVGVGIAEEAKLRGPSDAAVSLEWRPNPNPNGSPSE